MFQVSSCVESISTRADNTIKIVIGTSELPANQAVEIFKLKGKQGWTLFSENPLEAKDIPTEPAPEFKSDKTPSQRLRAILYKYWELCTSKKPDFNTFYQSWIEHKIQEVKDLLPK